MSGLLLVGLSMDQRLQPAGSSLPGHLTPLEDAWRDGMGGHRIL